MLAALLSWRSGLWWLSWEWWRWCLYCGIKLLCSLLHTMTWRIIKPRKLVKPRKLEKFPRATSRKVQWRPGVGKESTGLKDCLDICSAWWWAESAVESLFCKTLLVPGNVWLQTWCQHIIDSSPLFFTSFARYDLDPLILCPVKLVCRYVRHKGCACLRLAMTGQTPIQTHLSLNATCT